MSADMKAIRARIKSVEATERSTGAMYLAACAKIRRATEKMERSAPYRRIMEEVFLPLCGGYGPYFRTPSPTSPVLYYIVAGDRGLAGGYNSQIFRLADSVLRERDYVFPIGKRAVEHYGSRERVVSLAYASQERFSSTDGAFAAEQAMRLYDGGAVGAVGLISTVYVSALSQLPKESCLLPLVDTEERQERGVEFEPGRQAVLRGLIPQYLAGTLYAAVAESFLCETAARRLAMDTAGKNAGAMLEELSLAYNKARQSAVTGEITEIVAGSGI